jgi:hypothetical protein
MVEAPMTPEEKLLRIIESPPEAARGMRAPARRSMDFKLTLKLLKAQYGEKFKALCNLKAFIAGIIFLAGLATFFLVVDFWLGLPRLSAIERLELLARKQGVGDLTLERPDFLAAYLQEITQRNIFSLPEPPSPAAATAAQAAAVPVARLQGLADQVKLVGIIWSEAPQAILEDSTSGRTFLVNRGGKVKDARVKDILKDRVILSYDGQEIELK